MKVRTLALSAVLAALVPAALPVAAQEVTLKIAHFLPSAAPAQQQVLEPWCAEMNKESQGRIQCQFYPAMQLGGTPAQLADQAKNGIADVVWTAPGYSAGRFPLIETFELPFVVKDPVSSSRAVWKFYQAHAQKEFAAYKVLAFHTDGGQAFHTAKKAVRSLPDINGLKLRTSTRMGAKTLQALGGSPVAMPPAQVTEAIAKGVVDGALTAWELLYPTKLSEVTKYHTQPAAGMAYPSATVLTVLMNQRKYDSLPADLKAIVDKTTGDALVERFGAVWQSVNEDTLKRIQEQGNEVITLDPAQTDALKQAARGVEDDWIKQMAGKKIDGKKLLDEARTLAGTN
ncbi:TRAP transporter substrate-binding protein [Comamonas faecalis]|uniref:TRAP transporter substrate-binding protein n=1 Tax=Comamonas faecalis TaxID=1387849 RepID=A0ABP7RRJ0_9BURK